MKVVKWIRWKDAQEKIASIDTIGGFVDGHIWEGYLDKFDSAGWPYLNAIKENVIDNNIKLTGEKHQYSDDGVPLFDDGTVAIFSYRAFGDLMAAIWNTVEDEDYSYMDFYM